jgi:hypothetical protein
MFPAALLILFALLIIITAPEREGMSVLSKIPTVAKAITAGVSAFVATFVPAYIDGNGMSVVEWITVAGATVVAAVAVWAVPNKPPADAQPELG